MTVFAVLFGFSLLAAAPGQAVAQQAAIPSLPKGGAPHSSSDGGGRNFPPLFQKKIFPSEDDHQIQTEAGNEFRKKNLPALFERVRAGGPRRGL